MRKPKSRTMRFSYMVWGRLTGSQCSHGVPATRERALALVNRFGVGLDNRGAWMRAAKYVKLDMQRPQELYAGYDYESVHLQVGSY